jgi:hydroxymethylglutaryl-CoA synthase
MEELNSKASDYTYAVFHQPNTKFPKKIAKELGFSIEQIKLGLLAPEIGNTYAGASVLGLTAILDVAQPGDRILAVSFGSGAGSDAFSIRVTERIKEARDKAPSTRLYINRSVFIDYSTYARWRTKIVQE